MSLKRLAKGDAILRSSLASAGVGVLDERFNSELATRTGRTAIQFPDITDDTVPQSPTRLAAELRSRAGGRAVIGLAGVVDRRKGLLTFLRIAELSQGSQPWFFAAVGPFDALSFSAREINWIEDVRRRLDSSLYLDLDGGRLSDGGDYNAVFQEFDVAWAAYEDFQGSSNTLTKAALFEKPIVGSDGGCIAARVEEFDLGVNFAPGDAADGYRAIARLLQSGPDTGWTPRFGDYTRFHSRHQLDASLRSLLEGGLWPTSGRL